ncbi:F-box domain-containing protein [Mycena chlorophos]|uniref:F-box domain-containing protein n=1 Tax=Mycena chlorophos TaxID=658473 RepID=A0A8H6TMX7_MYCCL|nr:F-box domain-containing protein [Mycena chlorophos]
MSSGSIRSSIANLERRIVALNTELAVLEAQRDEQRQRLDAIAYSGNPLPPAVLARIFRFAVDINDECDGVDPLPMRAGLRRTYALAGVCRQWKEIVFETPGLWTRVTVHCGRVKAALDALAVWLPRSKNLPVDISVRLIEPTASAAWDLLVPHSARWRNLELHIGSTESLVLSLANVAPTLPHLRSLSIKGDIAWEDGPTPLVAPNLHKLKITTPFVVYQLPLPFSQIKSLDLTSDTGSGILDILALMPELSSLVLSVRDTDTEGANASSTCTLTQLKSLRYNDVLPPYILAGLYTPLLTDLTFLRLPPLADLQALVERSGCVIRSLVVESRGQTELLEWLRALPSLQRVDLGVHTWTNDDFKALCGLVTEQGKLPELESITLRGCLHEIDARLLSDLVERRWHWVEGQARVHTLRLLFRPVAPKVDAMEGVRTKLLGEGTEGKYAGLKVKVWDWGKEEPMDV